VCAWKVFCYLCSLSVYHAVEWMDGGVQNVIYALFASLSYIFNSVAKCSLTSIVSICSVAESGCCFCLSLISCKNFCMSLLRCWTVPLVCSFWWRVVWHYVIILLTALDKVGYWWLVRWGTSLNLVRLQSAIAKGCHGLRCSTIYPYP